MYAGHEATEDAALGRLQARTEIGTIPEPHPSGDTPFCKAWEQWHLPPLTTPANDNHRLPRVVALTGKAGSGKSTVADYLISRHGYVRVKFAGPLKDMMRAIGLNDNQIEGDQKETPTRLLQGKTPRYAMQTIGTEWGRQTIGENFWTFLWEDAALKILDAGGRVVVDDCRFDNESETVREIGGLVIEIWGRGGISGNHSSEAGCDADVVLRNDGTISDLHRRADELLFGQR